MSELSGSINTIDSEPTAKTPGKNRLNQIILLAAAIFLLQALFNYSTQTGEVNMLLKGDSMPPFSLELLDGGSASEKDFLGKPTMYVFYADWCPCSHQSVEWFKQAHNTHKTDGLNILFIGIQDTTQSLENFARLHKIKMPVNVNGGSDIADRVGVSVTPTTLFVDGAGVIQSIFVGKVTVYDQLSVGLKSILPSTAGQA
jgi:peroxiredoxin